MEDEEGRERFFRFAVFQQFQRFFIILGRFGGELRKYAAYVFNVFQRFVRAALLQQHLYEIYAGHDVFRSGLNNFREVFYAFLCCVVPFRFTVNFCKLIQCLGVGWGKFQGLFQFPDRFVIFIVEFKGLGPYHPDIGIFGVELDGFVELLQRFVIFVHAQVHQAQVGIAERFVGSDINQFNKLLLSVFQFVLFEISETQRAQGHFFAGKGFFIHGLLFATAKGEQHQQRKGKKNMSFFHDVIRKGHLQIVLPI